jgi:hypothetical protein
VRPILLLIGLGLGISSAHAQPAGPSPTPPSGSGDPGLNLPSIQRLEIRQDTPAEREVFLERRRQQMLGQQIEQVKPLPAQRVAPSIVTPAR